MTQTATITRIMPNGSFTTQNGQFFSFHVEFDGNGLSIFEANAKSATPKWQVGQQIWYTVTGEHQGIKKVKISTLDPAGAIGGGNQQGGGGNWPGTGGARTQDPATTKRIENSWAVQTAVEIAGPMKGDQEQYLEKIQNLAGHLLTIRDRVEAIETIAF